MSSIFSALVTVFGIMLLGFAVERRRILAPDMALCLNQFVYWISLPAMLFSQMSSVPMSGEAQAFAGVTLASSMLCYLAAYLFFSSGFRNNRPEATIRTLACVFPNAAFFGLPFLFMVFPGNETAATAGVLCTLFYSGVFLTADATLDVQRAADGGTRVSPLRGLRELAHNPMILASLLGACAGFSGVMIPAPVLKITEMLGSTAAPCALFGMGMVLSAQLSGVSSGQGNDLRALCIIAAGKLFLQPLLTFAVLSLAGCSGVTLAAGVIIAAMPSGTLVYVLGERYRACPAEASMTVIVTTLLSVGSLPVIMFLLKAAQVLS